MRLTGSTTLQTMPISTGSSALGTIKIRYLETRKLADGSTGYYYCPPAGIRRSGVCFAESLGKDALAAGSRAEILNQQIDDWRAGRENRNGHAALGSISWLIDKFESSHQYKRGAPATRTWYSGALKALREHRLETMALGDVPARRLTSAHVDALYLALQKLKDGEPTQLPWANAIMRA